MAGNSSEADVARWKDKYFSLQEKSESKDKLLTEQNDLYARLILRLCMAAEGQNSETDKSLTALREAVKDAQGSNINRLKETVSALNNALLRLDDEKSAQLSDFSGAIENLSSQLLQLDPPRPLKSDIASLRKAVDKRVALNPQVAPILKKLAETQRAVIEASQSGEEKPKGILDRIFGQDDAEQHNEATANSASSKDSISSDEDLHELAGEPSSAPPSMHTTPAFAAVATHVKQSIVDLIEQLSFPPTADRQLVQLKKSLAKPLNWYELVPLIDDTASLVLTAVGGGHKDFEQFLSQINNRLIEIQTLLLGALQVEQNHRDQDLGFRESLRGQVTAIQTSLDDQTDIDSLKDTIKNQVDKISKALDTFQQQSQNKENEQEQELTALQEKLTKMEQQSQEFQARLQEERGRAMTDPLTQLPNRQAFDDRFELEHQRWSRYKHSVSFAIADIDHFKTINDQYGHLSGDKVLQILAKELKSRLRTTDFVGRYGGEEFVMIFPETDVTTAERILNKVRETIGRLPFHFRETNVAVSVSFGLVSMEEGMTIDEVFDLADKALYKAKQNGRNRVEIGRPENQ